MIIHYAETDFSSLTEWKWMKVYDLKRDRVIMDDREWMYVNVHIPGYSGALVAMDECEWNTENTDEQRQASIDVV